MKGTTWQKIAKTLGIVGGVGGACAAGATLIKLFKPEAAELTVDQTAKISECVNKAIEAREKAKKS